MTHRIKNRVEGDGPVVKILRLVASVPVTPGNRQVPLS